MSDSDFMYFSDCVESEKSVADYVTAPSSLLPSLTDVIASGCIVVFKQFASEEHCERLVRYFHRHLLSGFEEFVPINQNCKNYIRFSHDDPRAEVPLFCDSISFFPWNRDRFDLFSHFSDVYRLKNLFSGADSERYLDGTVSERTTARIAAHYYPAGKGHLGTHIDPLGSHQEITCTLILKKPNLDEECGYYLLNKDKKKVFVESSLGVGDFYIGSPAIPHGVKRIAGEYDPEASDGRWALLFPVNKTADNTVIGDSKNV